MFKGKNSNLSQAAIDKAQQQYDSSIQIFQDAQQKISQANQTLATTIEDIDTKIVELEKLRYRAEQDKVRNAKMQNKLDEFLAID